MSTFIFAICSKNRLLSSAAAAAGLQSAAVHIEKPLLTEPLYSTMLTCQEYNFQDAGDEKMSCHKIVIGDSRRMAELNDESVHLVVTSPPYWQLKDYGPREQIGYNDSADHGKRGMAA